MFDTMSYLDSQSSGSINSTIQIDRSVPSVSNGLANYSFKFSVFPENSNDILDLDFAKIEVAFIAQKHASPGSPYVDPKGNIEVLKMPDEDSLVNVADPTGDYLKTFGEVGTFFTFASSVNPITTGFSILASLVNKQRTMVGKTCFKKYEADKLIVGMYVNAKVKENDTAAGYYNFPLEFKCNPELELLMPSKITIDTNKSSHEYKITHDAGKVIARFKNFTSWNIAEGEGLPENSIVFICESGSYISEGKTDGTHPLPGKYGNIIGNIFEKVVVRDNTTVAGKKWKGERLYPVGHPLTLIKLSFTSPDYTEPKIEHIKIKVPVLVHS